VPTRAERVELIGALEAERGATVIAYLTSTRPGLEAQMAMDAISVIYRHLQSLPAAPADTKIDLFLHSNGGEGTVPWRLVSLLREYCAEFCVLVPHNAFSAATLTALGADRVVMHPMGMLGPTDPTANHPFNPINPQAPDQVLGISVEDVSSYIALVKDDVGIRHEDELVQAFSILARRVHPLALGNVKRATLQSRMMGEKLLNLRGGSEMGAHEQSELIDKLTSQLYFHGHPINRKEAKDDLRLDFVEEATPEVETAMWELYSAYIDDMLLQKPFDPVAELASLNAIPAVPPINPGAGNPPSVQNTALGPYNYAYVESSIRTDVFKLGFEATAQRDVLGALNTNVLRTKVGWEQEP
jgi:hypothetical protein